jgi:hypothetical protein
MNHTEYDTNIFIEPHGRPFLGKEIHEDIIKMNHSEYDVWMLRGKKWPEIRKNGRLFPVTAEAVDILLTIRETLYQRLITYVICIW